MLRFLCRRQNEGDIFMVFQAEHLSKAYGKEMVLHDISFTVNEGDIVGLIGENGAGKSTLISILSGVNRADGGTFSLDGGLTPADSVEYYRDLCTAFDSAPFYMDLTGFTNLRLYSDDKEEIYKYLKICGIDDAADKKVGKYSMGMRQRLNIARAFLMWNRMLIMDEPINGLDPSAVTDIKKYVKEECAKGRCALISSHALKELIAFCTRFIFLSEGRLILEIAGDGEFLGRLNCRGNIKDAELAGWLKENNADCLKVPELNRIYFSGPDNMPEGLVFRRLETGINVLEDIYIKLRKTEG